MSVPDVARLAIFDINIQCISFRDLPYVDASSRRVLLSSGSLHYEPDLYGGCVGCLCGNWLEILPRYGHVAMVSCN